MLIVEQAADVSASYVEMKVFTLEAQRDHNSIKFNRVTMAFNIQRNKN
jgi:hypothetical protein